MLSVSSIKSGGGAAAYYEGLATTDYYTNGGEPPGQYYGARAEALGLRGEVKEGELKAAFAGFHPGTGEALVKNAGESHKAGWDCTFSAPKSVSIAWGVAGPETRKIIEAAHNAGVAAGIKEIEQNAVCKRFGADGIQRASVDGGVVAMAYQHSTNRNGEINLHDHCLIANIGPDGRCIELDTRWKMEAGAAYRVAMADALQKGGFEVERDKSSFRMTCIEKGLEKELSSRRAEIVEKLREKGMSGGAAAAAAALDTRNDKGEIDRSKFFETTRQHAAEYGITAEKLQEARTAKLENGECAPAPATEMISQEEIMRLAIQQNSTLTEQQLQTLVMQEAQCVLTVEQAKQYIDRLMESDHLIELRDSSGGVHYTSQEMYDIECRLYERAAAMSKEQTHPLAEGALAASMVGKTPSDEQKAALEFITGPERIACVQGVAGAGKSYLLAIANEAWTRSGYDVYGCALAGKAGDGLLKSSSIDSKTIAKTLIMMENGKMVLDSKSIVVVDEAGMVGSRQMEQLQAHIDKAGSKLCVVGEAAQIQPVDNGGAFRAQIDACGKHIEMLEIRRQQSPEEMVAGKLFDTGIGAEERAMVMNARAGDFAKVLEHLEKYDRLKVFETRAELNKAMASAVVADLKAGKTSQAMVGTRAEVAIANELARREYRENGMLTSEDNRFKATFGNAANGEEVVQIDRSYAAGDRLIFLKNDEKLGVMNGTTGTVERAANGALTVRLDDTAKKGPDGKEDLATATRVEFQQDRYSHVDHAYGYTIHKTQGISTGGGHFSVGSMTNREMAYVAMSRVRSCGKDGVTMYCTKEQIADREAFIKQLNKSQPKLTSAHFHKVEKLEAKIETADERAVVAERAIAHLEAQITVEKLSTSSGTDNKPAVPTQSEQKQENDHERDQRYANADPERLADARRAAAGLHQPNHSGNAPGHAPETLDAVRNLSECPLAHEQGGLDRDNEVLLPGNASDHSETWNANDHGLRRPGSSDRQAADGTQQLSGNERIQALEKQLATALADHGRALRERDDALRIREQFDRKQEMRSQEVGKGDKPLSQAEIDKKGEYARLTIQPKGDRAKVFHDGDLAAKALESHRRGDHLPSTEKLNKGLDSGKYKAAYDSDGKQFIVRTKDNKVFSRDLNREQRSIESRNLNHLGLTKSKYVITDKRFLGLRYGSVVLKSGGTLKSELASKLRDKLRENTAGKSLGKAAARIASKPADYLLKTQEKWQKAGLVEGAVARVQIALEQRQQQRQTLKDLEAKAKAADQMRRPDVKPALKPTEKANDKPAEMPLSPTPGADAAKRLSERPANSPAPVLAPTKGPEATPSATPGADAAKALSARPAATPAPPKGPEPSSPKPPSHGPSFGR